MERVPRRTGNPIIFIISCRVVSKELGNSIEYHAVIHSSQSSTRRQTHWFSQDLRLLQTVLECETETILIASLGQMRLRDGVQKEFRYFLSVFWFYCIVVNTFYLLLYIYCCQSYNYPHMVYIHHQHHQLKTWVKDWVAAAAWQKLTIVLCYAKWVSLVRRGTTVQSLLVTLVTYKESQSVVVAAIVAQPVFGLLLKEPPPPPATHRRQTCARSTQHLLMVSPFDSLGMDGMRWLDGWSLIDLTSRRLNVCLWSPNEEEHRQQQQLRLDSIIIHWLGI